MLVLTSLRTVFLVLFSAAALLLAGCHNDNAKFDAPSPVPSFEGEFDLNKALSSQFGERNPNFGWRWSQASFDPMNANEKNDWLQDWEGQDLAVDSQTFHLLDATHVVVIAQAQNMGEDGMPEELAASPGLVFALFFEQNKGRWTLQGKPVGVTFSDAGEIQTAQIGQNLKGFTTQASLFSENDFEPSYNSIDIFSVQNLKVESVKTAHPIMTAYSSCKESVQMWREKGIEVPWLKDTKEPPKPHLHKEGEEPESHEQLICHVIESSWKFEKGEDADHYDLVLDFTEKAHEARKDGSETREIHFTHKPVRYTWKKEGYTLTSGENPIVFQ